MYKKLAMSSTDVRKDFGAVIDKIIRFSPVVIKRSRDYFVGISIDDLQLLLKDTTFTIEEQVEEDGSITLSLLDFSNVTNGKTREEALSLLIAELRAYTEECYNRAEYWNGDGHIRVQLDQLMKVMITDDNSELEKSFKWRKKNDRILCNIKK